MIKMRPIWILWAVIVLSCGESKYSEPWTPEESLQGFNLDDQFDIELFAAEPLVMDPVEMVFDEKR